MSNTHSIAGGWLGTYYYDSMAERTRFEASFSRIGVEGKFSGRILDDGPLGEANAEGMQSGLSVVFTKVYIQPPEGHATYPVQYEGEMSDDGKRITGIWHLTIREPGERRHTVRGTWEARRIWFGETEEDSRVESEGLLIGAR
ncbi:MAG: hypothetical protein OHK0029_03970 [Armatimonadaceae bacterium]